MLLIRITSQVKEILIVCIILVSLGDRMVCGVVVVWCGVLWCCNC